MTDWKTWPKCGFFNVFFLFSDQQTCQIWVGYSFEIWNLILDEQDTRQNTRVEEVCCSKCFIVSVISFLVFFDKQVIKNWKKIKQAKKNSNLEICWIKRAPKNKCARQLWDIGFIFFSLRRGLMYIKTWHSFFLAPLEFAWAFTQWVYIGCSCVKWLVYLILYHYILNLQSFTIL